MKIKNGKELIGKHLNGKACIAIYKVVEGAVVTLWEGIRSFFFTRDGLNIETRDGKIFDAREL